MKMTFRWQGEQDKVPLKYIRQIPGMTGIVSAVYDVKPGEIWSHESIEAVKKQANDNGLEFEVVESVPVPEAIKLAKAMLGNENASITAIPDGVSVMVMR